MNRFVIELMGPPGSGKSHFHELAASKFDKAPKPTEKHRRKAIIVSLSFAPFIVLFPRKRHGLIRMFQRKLAAWYALTERTTGSYLVEEGPWNFLCSSLGTRIPRWAITPVLRMWSVHLDLPDAIIYLDGDPKFLSARIEHRGRRNERLKTPSDLEFSRERIAFFLTKLKEAHPDTAVFNFRTDEEGVDARMASQVDNILDSTRAIRENPPG